MEQKPFWKSATKLILILFGVSLCSAFLFSVFKPDLDIFTVVSKTFETGLLMVLAFYFGQKTK